MSGGPRPSPDATSSGPSSRPRCRVAGRWRRARRRRRRTRVGVATTGGPRRRRRSAQSAGSAAGRPALRFPDRRGARGPGSRSRSRNSTESRMPPSPSVIVWCIRCSIAARPPRSPSMVTNSHSGRSRSKGWAARRAARSWSSASSASPPRSTQRRWWSRSKSGSSTHSGCSNGLRPTTTRSRRRGTARVASSMRARKVARTGARSNTVRFANAEDSWGSDSRAHMSVSSPVMCWSSVASTSRLDALLGLGPVPPRGDAMPGG